MRFVFVSILLLGISLNGKGQSAPAKSDMANDTILFNNGKVLAVHVMDTSGDKITIEKPNSHKHKKVEIDRDAVFSIIYGSTGKEVVVYIYDTLTGHDYTIPEARLFIAGEQDAQKGFHATATTIAAFGIGLFSGIATGSFIAFGPPFLYAGIMSYPRIHIRHKSVKNLNNVKQDPYLYGYDNTARRKRTFKAFLWSGIGLVTGLTLNFTGAFNDIVNHL